MFSAVASAAEEPAASEPRGGRPVAPYVASPEAREAMQQGRQTLGPFGFTRRQTGDPEVEMKDDPMPLARQLAEELCEKLEEQCNQRTLEELKEHYKTVLSKSNSHIKRMN